MIQQYTGSFDPSAPEEARQALGTEAPRQSPLEAAALSVFPSVSYNCDNFPGGP